MNRKAILALTVLCIVGVSPIRGSAKDSDHAAAVQDAVVQFGHGQPQPTPAPVTHLLDPDDVTINKGGTVTFVVNGGGHGVAIYPVAKKTTREDIAADLCQGGTNEADRLGRSLVCNGTVVTTSGIVGTQNLAYTVTDGTNDVVVLVPTNTAAAPNPRVDDMTNRLIATSGGIPGDGTANPAGAFLTGTAPAVAPATGFTAGNRIQYRFLKTGRYLVICMNRSHYLNDHMFGFVNVVDADDDDHGN
jgi:hypothetical protein